MNTQLAERIEHTIVAPSRTHIVPAEVDPLPPQERVNGAAVTGTIFHSGLCGYRVGDSVQGVITDKISEEIMLVTNWQGVTFFGVLFIEDCRRLHVLTPSGPCTFYAEDFSLIAITARRTAKGSKFAPVMSKEERLARAVPIGQPLTDSSPGRQDPSVRIIRVRPEVSKFFALPASQLFELEFQTAAFAGDYVVLTYRGHRLFARVSARSYETTEGNLRRNECQVIALAVPVA